VSFGSCMLRIPSSHNSKCVQRNYDKADFTTAVKIINKWNGHRAPAYLLIGSFLSYLVDQKLKEIKRQRQSSKYRHEDNNKPSIKTTTIPWIETLLQTPLSDHRKYCIWRILVPYLINVRRVSSYEESYSAINCKDCNKLQRLNFDARVKIKEGLKGASKGYFPISLEKLKEDNKELYDIVLNRPAISSSN
jgi:Primase X